MCDPNFIVIFEIAKEKYLSIGFNGYVSKPINRENLKMEIDKIFKNQ